MLNYNRETLPFKTTTGRLFSICKSYLNDITRELEEFLASEDFMNNKSFAEKVMFTHELKANNTVEGITDSVDTIEKVIEAMERKNTSELVHRITNLYRGYKYILKGHKIDEDSVSHLYKILSKDLLCREDLVRMNDKYRTDVVYILQNGRLDDTRDLGLDAKLIPEYMKCYFDYVNNGEQFGSITDYFIKSQLMHFYFVYIHPYFDINGRTSRTIAMWYLLNNDIYPYIIFNRGISVDAHYDKLIRESKKYYDLTRFVYYMLFNVKKELEKEYIMHYLQLMSSRNWESLDFQTLEYILSTKDNINVLDFVKIYNRFNDKKRVQDVYERMIVPLLEDGTLVRVRETKKFMFNDVSNLEFMINSERLKEIDTSKVSRLVLKK